MTAMADILNQAVALRLTVGSGLAGGGDGHGRRALSDRKETNRSKASCEDQPDRRSHPALSLTVLRLGNNARHRKDASKQ